MSAAVSVPRQEVCYPAEEDRKQRIVFVVEWFARHASSAIIRMIVCHGFTERLALV